MNTSKILRALCVALFLVMIGWAPEFVLAHGGGGGFHGGGGGFHGGGYHGGGYYGGGRYHGGGGWGGGYWGYPGYGYGWGFSIGFNWGPFWGGYGYPYGYAWGPSFSPYYYPYPYPYYVPAGSSAYADSSRPNSNYAYSSGQSSSFAPDYSRAQQSSASAPPRAPATNSVTIREASYTATAPSYGTYAGTAPSSNYAVARHTLRQISPLRPEVQNVIRALRGMPPAARERQITSGRYSNLSPKELEFVRYAADLPPA